MTHTDFNERRLGDLIAALPPAPEAWEQAAIELPRLRRTIDQVLALAETDAAFRAELTADLEQALRGAGFEPHPGLNAAVRQQLAGN